MPVSDPTWDTSSDPKPTLTRSVLTWLYLKSQADELVARTNQAKERVTRAVRDSADAYLDDRGHLYVDLDEPLTVGETTYAAVKREKRITRTANEDRAAELAEKLGLTDRLFPSRPVFDEQELFVLYQDGLLTEAQIDDLYDIRENWALKAVPQ
jgi:hypothetical protein